jgi:uncharacterized protein (TIRG00374 family)
MASSNTTPFRWQRWIWPVVIGIASTVAVAWWWLRQEISDPITQLPIHPLDLLRSFSWSTRASAATIGLLICIILRDLGYIYRLRILSQGRMSWRQSFDSIMLWELASALTPSVVGGSAAAVWILKREGMRWGKSLATVFATALMDELFYLLAVPLMFGIAVLSDHAIFPAIAADIGGVEGSLAGLFGVAYVFIGCLTMIILWGLILRPQTTHKNLIRGSEWKTLRKWKPRIARWADDLLEASEAMRHSTRAFWGQAFLATCASWCARFATLNMVFLIFYSSVPHAALIARQLVLWLVLTISPTPGSSGAAELGLSAVTSDLMGIAYMAVVVLIWRIATYFLYLVLGAFVLPRWLLKTRNQSPQREPIVAA